MTSNKRDTLFLASAVLFACLLSACSTSRTLEQTPLDPSSTAAKQGDKYDLQPLVRIVCTRHDAGLTTDTTLSDTQKQMALAESYLFRKAFEQKELTADTVAGFYVEAMNVLARHDRYAASITDPLAHDMALISSANIRRTLSRVMGKPDSFPTTQPVK